MSLSITFTSYETLLKFWVYKEGKKSLWDSINIDKTRATGLAKAIEDAFSAQRSGCFATRDTKFLIKRLRFLRYRIEFEEVVRAPQIELGQATFPWSAGLWSWQVWQLYKTLKSLAN